MAILALVLMVLALGAALIVSFPSTFDGWDRVAPTGCVITPLVIFAEASFGILHTPVIGWLYRMLVYAGLAILLGAAAGVDMGQLLGVSYGAATAFGWLVAGFGMPVIATGGWKWYDILLSLGWLGVLIAHFVL